MLIFFFIVTIYISANLHLFFKLSSLINLGTPFDIFLVAIILFMTLAPVLIPIYSNSASEKNSRAFAYTGFLWLGFLVIFFPSAFIIDIYHYVLQFIGPIQNSDYSHLILSPEKSFFIPMFFSLAINIYGFFEAGILRTERLVMKTTKLPDGVNKLRIAQISDLHLSLIIRESKLNKAIETINSEAPDIIVSTGDLVDGSIRHISHLSENLATMKAPMGKFAVLGNHEIYGGMKHSVRFTEKSGFRLLRGEGITVEQTINIAGMDFSGGEARTHSKKSKQRPEHEVLSGLPQNLYSILLKHKSDVEDESLGLFDLQLSGHTHGGQIFPMNLATMFMFPYFSGFTKLEKGSAIYTSRGTGTSGPPIRFLSAPEITIIDIVKEHT